jgi:hypothetical protein
VHNGGSLLAVDGSIITDTFLDRPADSSDPRWLDDGPPRDTRARTESFQDVDLEEVGAGCSHARRRRWSVS